MALTKAQEKRVLKAKKLILEAQELFNSANLHKDWCPIFGQTESSVNRAAALISSFVEYKIEK